MLDLDLSVRVLVNRERVDHADGVFVMQSLELSDDLAVKFGVVEANDDQLNRSDRHRSRLFSPVLRASGGTSVDAGRWGGITWLG